jgi:hypothetical protein
MHDPRARRIAQNETSARRVNESIDEERAEEGEPGPRWFVCECAHADCAELLDVGSRRYHEIRANPHHFIVLPGHEEPDVEVVVEARPEYLVVEKVGEARRIADRESD